MRRRYVLEITLDHEDDNPGALTRRMAKAYEEYAQHIQTDLTSAVQFSFTSSDNVRFEVTEET